MKIIETKLKDCYIIEPDVFNDERGYFMEFYSDKKMDKARSVLPKVVQGNRSFSKKGTLRGLHYQKGETSQAKLVECLEGAVLDIAVDLRKDSPTYKEWVSVELTATNHRQLLIPKGFAHGFLTLEDNTLFQYLVDYPYSPSTEGGILWCDDEINVDWQFEKYNIKEPVLSEKDKVRKPLRETEVDF